MVKSKNFKSDEPYFRQVSVISVLFHLNKNEATDIKAFCASQLGDSVIAASVLFRK